ncbi:hypothetical protein C8F04DRAFT_1196418 [Mycena alexandri]|uniref:Uncharacterized protein n=1 Tax=Mycena alexandri TaxID=1745969 RepID=A0AAD6S4F7_9AGAR|nr:hypothetical protein C8F04DRAFT_1196418 [Mycena alexandri]
MLGKIRNQPQLSLALARYQQQFVAVRERSDGHDSVFAFKRGLSILINPYSERRWAQPSHSALAYGEIKTVYRMPEAGAFCIVLTCPMSASCDAIYMFARQLLSLERILDLDMLESPGAIAVSWFDRSQEDPRMRRRRGSFYVTLRSENEAEASEYEQIFITDNPVGKMFECLLGFQRRHIGTSTGSSVISKAYELNVIQSTVHQSDCGCIPSRIADYVCDMPGDGVCKARRRRDKLVLMQEAGCYDCLFGGGSHLDGHKNCETA